MTQTNTLSRKISITFFLLLTSIIYIYAVRAYPGMVTITQPDGVKLTIKINGDEFFKYRTTADGYLVTQNASGYYVYASIDAQGKMIASAQVAKNADKRNAADAQFLMKMPENIILNAPKSFRVKSNANNLQKPRKAFPLIGSPKSLVIMVNFTDKSFVVPSSNTAFDNLLNQAGYSANGGTGSAKDYFMASSYGKFTPQFNVVGPYMLPQNMAYYGGNDADGDVNATQLIADACLLANNAGVDFTQYDTDSDGYVDNVFIYYAGYNEAEGASANTIWPHRWSIIPGWNYSGTQASVTFDGKIVYDYACTSELGGVSGSNMCGIGTFCHEFGHVLGLPDFYDTDGIQSNTLDYWSIMDYGAYSNEGRTPPVYSAYERFYLGYSSPTEISTGTNVTLNPLSQTTTIPSNYNNQSVLLSASAHNLNGSSPNPNEFFILEYRKLTGWDSYLPAEGLLIWHIDYDATAWNENSPNNYTGTTQTAASHMRVYLQPLSGSSTTPGTAFTSGNFTPTTWSGTNINRPVTEIAKTATEVTFKVMGGLALPNKVFLGVVENSLSFPTIKMGKTKVKNINIKTTDITSNLSAVLSGADVSSFSVSTTTITQATANSTGYDLQITYTPQAVGTHNAVLTISGGGLPSSKVINLSGAAN